MIAPFSAESRQVLPAAAGVIPVFAKKRLSQKSSGRPSRRSRTLPAFFSTLCRGWHVPQGQALCGGAAPRTPVALGLPTSPSSGSVPSSAVRAEARSLFSAILLLLAVACSRPSSYEQFVRAEDAADGVYEFTLSFMDAEASAETSVSSGSGTSDVTYDLSFYTAPLAEPLQLEVTWLYSSAEVFPVSQKHGHQEQIPRENVPGPPSERDTGNTLIAPVFSETVWFPAGQHRALYRSGINFSDDLSRNTPKSLQVPPKNPLPVEKNAEISTGTPQNTPTCIENGEKLDRSAMSTLVIPSAHSVIPGEAKEPSSASYATAGSKSIIIQVKPINPPEGLRGLGIICKTNYGTR